MNSNLLRVLLCLVSLPLVTVTLPAQEAGSATTTLDPATANAAAAAVAGGAVKPGAPDFVEYLVDLFLGLFGVQSSGNAWQHWVIAGLITVLFYVLRKVVAKLAFSFFKKLTARTETTLDDELIVSWERPVAVFIAVLGAIIALKVLKLTPEAEEAFYYFRTIALSVVALWFFITTISCVLDHLEEVAKKKGTAVAAFMPWIKKSIIALILVFGVLIAAQSLGADVKAFLAGLGIGGLAFALAAQDTLANMFGSVVVAVDQPFRVGEFVQIGAFQGTVEDIGLRSTKLRTPQRTLIIIPNKTVAAEAINNFTRMPQRRVDQTIGLTYDTPPEKLEAVLADIRGLLVGNPDVAQDYIVVNFTNYGAFSLDIQIVYFTANPDMRQTFALREKINFAIMRSVQARGCSFAFPTQTIEFAGEIAKRLGGGGGTGAASPQAKS
jgi:MscS family membrane protein